MTDERPKLTIELVMRIGGRGSAEYLGKTLSRDDITFVVVPQIGDSVSWNNEWGAATCIYRIVAPDYIEIGLTACAPSEIEDFVAAGWRLR